MSVVFYFYQSSQFARYLYRGVMKTGQCGMLDLIASATFDNGNT